MKKITMISSTVSVLSAPRAFAPTGFGVQGRTVPATGFAGVAGRLRGLELDGTDPYILHGAPPL